MSASTPSRFESHFAEYDIHSTLEFKPEQLISLTHLLHQKIIPQNRSLSGRAPILTAEIPGIGKVVIKQYLRGGALRHVISRLHFRYAYKNSRPRIEFERLIFVRSVGVIAPEPLASITTGGMWYRGWLVTRRVDGALSLAEPEIVSQVLQHPEKFGFALFEKIAHAIRLLIANGILHIDLHPGNVLLDRDKNPYLIDFDKARLVRMNSIQLRDQYLRRWRRAVIKHQLPELFSEMLSATLRVKEGHTGI